MDRLKISVEYQYRFVHNASIICMIILPVNKTSEILRSIEMKIMIAGGSGFLAEP
jgi:hypothetical protein